MRTSAAVFALAAFALPAAAGPIDTLQYRATFGVLGSSGPGPNHGAAETAYPLGGPPLFGVVVSSSPEWSDAYPAYPSADFAFLLIGRLNPYIAGGLPTTNLSVRAQYSLDFELRDNAGRVGVIEFQGSFDTGWSSWGGYAIPFNTPHGYPFGNPQGSVLLGDTRYDVQLSHDTTLIHYTNLGGGFYFPWRLPPFSTPYPDGDYTSQSGALLYATITAAPEPVGTPEPGTLLLAGVGLCGLLAVRRLRRTAV
jgi:hypothetical protein